MADKTKNNSNNMDKNKSNSNSKKDDSRGKNSRRSGGGNNDRSSNRNREHRNHSSHNQNGAGSRTQSSSNIANTAKFSGMAFTESELNNEIPKKKFTGRCRLFVGNLPNEVKEAELKELFTPHGDISECYLSGKGFAFLRLDTRAHAESAKEALDGKLIQGRQVRVRFAVHGATIKVKELAPVVSNEMLYLTFSAFGDVERAVHIVDEKGKPTGEGIVEFERKASAIEALSQIKDRVFLMTSNSRPLTAEMLEPKDEEDGLSERMLQRTAQERELGPRFAALNSFEYVYGQRWKALYDGERKRREDLENELKESRKRLEADMEIAYEDYRTQLLREGRSCIFISKIFIDLQRRQQELERLEASKRERMRNINGRPGGFGPPFAHEQIMDGPMGRNPPTFGGARNFAGNFSGPPPPLAVGLRPPPPGPGEVPKIMIPNLLNIMNSFPGPNGPPRGPPHPDFYPPEKRMRR